MEEPGTDGPTPVEYFLIMMQRSDLENLSYGAVHKLDFMMGYC